jgi:hypothetical protein
MFAIGRHLNENGATRYDESGGLVFDRRAAAERVTDVRAAAVIMLHARIVETLGAKIPRKVECYGEGEFDARQYGVPYFRGPHSLVHRVAGETAAAAKSDALAACLRFVLKQLANKTYSDEKVAAQIAACAAFGPAEAQAVQAIRSACADRGYTKAIAALAALAGRQWI